MMILICYLGGFLASWAALFACDWSQREVGERMPWSDLVLNTLATALWPLLAPGVLIVIAGYEAVLWWSRMRLRRGADRG
jgi:fluoride ion exporter CrcB/FEX